MFELFLETVPTFKTQKSIILEVFFMNIYYNKNEVMHKRNVLLISSLVVSSFNIHLCESFIKDSKTKLKKTTIRITFNRKLQHTRELHINYLRMSCVFGL